MIWIGVLFSEILSNLIQISIKQWCIHFSGTSEHIVNLTVNTLSVFRNNKSHVCERASVGNHFSPIVAFLSIEFVLYCVDKWFNGLFAGSSSGTEVILTSKIHSCSFDLCFESVIHHFSYLSILPNYHSDISKSRVKDFHCGYHESPNVVGGQS